MLYTRAYSTFKFIQESSYESYRIQCIKIPKDQDLNYFNTTNLNETAVTIKLYLQGFEQVSRKFSTITL